MIIFVIFLFSGILILKEKDGTILSLNKKPRTINFSDERIEDIFLLSRSRFNALV